MQKCGVPVDAGEVPHDYFKRHPTQIRREMDLAMIRAEVVGPICDLTYKAAAASKGDVDDETPLESDDLMGRVVGSSRFYLKRRIIIGNSAKFLGEQKRRELFANYNSSSGGGGGKNIPTHMWRLYVKTPNNNYHKGLGSVIDSTHQIGSFIKGIRFILHPSFKPNDIIDKFSCSQDTADGTEIELIQCSYGEFPVRIQIYFWDPKNKPIELVHHLRFLSIGSTSSSQNNRFVTVCEQVHEIEIDRKTIFVDNPLLNCGSGSEREFTDLLPIESDEELPLNSTCIDLLTLVIDDFPLAGQMRGQISSSATDGLFYEPMPSMESFMRLPLLEQKEHERERARSVWQFLTSKYPSSFTLSVDEILSWCREKGHTPKSIVTLLTSLEHTDNPLQPLLYCRFCGAPHLPQERFEILQKNCSSRPRKIHLCSRSPFGDLIAGFGVWEEGSEMARKLKNEYMSSSSTSSSTSSTAITAGQNLRLFSHHQQQHQQHFLPKTLPYNYYDDRPILSSLSEEQLLILWSTRELNKLKLPRLATKPKLPPPVIQLDRAPTDDPTLTIPMLTIAMRAFLSDIISKSILEIPKPSVERGSVLLTPLHIYRVASREPIFDFLTNAHMYGGGRVGGSTENNSISSTTIVIADDGESREDNK